MQCFDERRDRMRKVSHRLPWIADCRHCGNLTREYWGCADTCSSSTAASNTPALGSTGHRKSWIGRANVAPGCGNVKTRAGIQSNFTSKQKLFQRFCPERRRARNRIGHCEAFGGIHRFHLLERIHQIVPRYCHPTCHPVMH
jgi:hypothetical protein